ncbi:putative ribonuclease H-like domain-containing protein [Tanacetum coccineum]|uniref:Ribonuclease H-like domain-containing protein n=1 Tax=Tanacetum coccineum TaxID=301880 RepID=A0ABQ5ABG1_9ASTR
MAKQAELNKRVCKGTGLRENRPVWNNVQRVNHQNQFVPTAVLTRTGKIPVNTARQNFLKQAVPRKVNTAKRNFVPMSPKMNENDAYKRQNVFKRSHSPVKRSFQNKIVTNKLLWKPKTNTTNANHVNIVGSQAVVNIANGYKGNADDPHKALKNKGIVDSGCSRHMTGNKAYLVDYQDYNGGPVAFGGSKGYITGKDTECLVLSPEFKLPDENQVLLRIPRQNNMYSFNLENIVPTGGLACLIAKATVDESNMWHRRLGHVNFKNLNKLVKGNLVRGLPSKVFQNDHTCVTCQKGKQHKASCKAKSMSSISQPLQLLHMDLFRPTSVRSINHKTYFLVITDDFSRFSWVFFLRTKDETSAILKDFIRQVENQLNKKVKTIRCDNATKFKNRDMIEFCGSKGIKREYSNARTLQQNRVAKRKNRTLIKAARTMLADLFLPNTFRAKAVSTACYILNRVLVTKPQNKTPYDLITDSMNYQPVKLENQANKPAGPKETNHSAEIKNGDDKSKEDTSLKYKEKPVDEAEQAFLEELERHKKQEKDANDAAEALRKEVDQGTKDLLHQTRDARASGTKTVSTASPSRVLGTDKSFSPVSFNYADQDDSQIPALEDIYDNPTHGIFSNASYDDEGVVTDFTNLETFVDVSPISKSRIHSIHPTSQILGDPKSAVQTRSKVEKGLAHALASYIQQQKRNNHKDF